MSKPVCVIVGVGPGNGYAFVKKFHSEGYQVAFLARRENYLRELEGQFDGSRGYPCDVTNINQIKDVFQQITEELGTIEILIYNVGSGRFKNVEEVTIKDFEVDWQINTRGCLLAAQQVIPEMVREGKGSIVMTGATAALKGGANSSSFASAKASQRSLAQSMARHLGPKGIHVAYVILDAIVDIPKTRQAMPDKPDEFFIKPDHIAETFFYLTQQPKSAWTFELDLRPFMETF